MDGCEWVVDAYGCDAAALADPDRLKALFARLVRELALNPVDYRVSFLRHLYHRKAAQSAPVHGLST